MNMKTHAIGNWNEKSSTSNNLTYLKFNGKSFQNNAYEGMNIENGKQYRVKLLCKEERLYRRLYCKG